VACGHLAPQLDLHCSQRESTLLFAASAKSRQLLYTRLQPAQ
jgi:hypothetical protein